MVYDTIGGPHGWNLLERLDTLGLYVALGETHGPMPPLDITRLERFSGFVTYPSIRDYKQARLEYVVSAFEVCELAMQGILTPFIGQRVDFSEIPGVLDTIASHQAVGASIAIIEG